MISIEKMTTELETTLNSAGSASGIVFKLFADDGKYVKPSKISVNEVLKPVNGVYSILTSNLLPFKGIDIYTIVCSLTVIVDIEQNGIDDNGNNIYLQAVKAILTEYAQTINGQTLPFNDSNKIYTISYTATMPTVGIESQQTPIGRGLPITLNISYVFTENGVNSNSYDFLLDGNIIPAQTGLIERVRTADGNNMGNELTTKTSINQNGISIDLNSPLLNNEFGDLLEEDVLNGGNNNAHALTIIRANKENKNYLVAFGNTKLGIETNKNIGSSFSILELQPDIAIFSDKWALQNSMPISPDIPPQTYIFLNCTLETDGMVATLTPTTGINYLFVVWGDGIVSSLIAPTNFISHTYSENKLYNVRIFGADSLVVVNPLNIATTTVSDYEKSVEIYQNSPQEEVGIYYNTAIDYGIIPDDPATPTAQSSLYSEPLVFENMQNQIMYIKIKAIGIKQGYTNSEVVYSTLSIQALPQKVNPITITIGGSSFSSTRSFTMTQAEPQDGIEIYYTIATSESSYPECADPTSSDNLYNPNISNVFSVITGNKTYFTVKAIGIKTGYQNSNITVSQFLLNDSSPTSSL